MFDEISMPKTILAHMLAQAAELGANAALAKSGSIKPYLSKQEAYGTYGRGNVDRWIREGLVTPRKDGGHSSKWRIDRQEIESIAMASNRPSYAMVKYRK